MMIDISPGAGAASRSTVWIASRAARSGASGVVRILALQRRPRASSATSVKVPPMSTPNLPPCSTARCLSSSLTRWESVCGVGPKCQSVQPRGGAGNGTAAEHPTGAPPDALRLGRLYADFASGVGDRLLLGAGGAVTALGMGNGTPGKGGESRRPPQVPVADRVVPDLPGLDPSVTAQCGRDQVEGVIGDAGIDVNPAIVLRGIEIVLHVGRLRILSEHVVVVGGAGGLHRAQSLVLGGQKPGTDQPVRFAGGLLQRILFDE